MYKRDLDAALRGGRVANFFLLYGGDNFELELYADLIKDHWGAGETLRVFFDEYDFGAANDFLGFFSFFAEKKLLEIKASKRPPAKDLRELIHLCEKNQNNFFLLQIYDESTRQTDLERIFQNNFARFFRPANAAEAAGVLGLRARRLGIEATQGALITLFELFDENLYLAAAELNKFAGLRLDEAAVRKYCQGLGEGSIDGFFEQLLMGRPVLRELERVVENFNEIAVLNYLGFGFYRLFKLFLFARVRGRIDFKELFGYAPPPQVAKRQGEWALALSAEKYREIFTLLLNTERELKLGQGLEKREYLLSALLRLVRVVRG